MLTVEEALANAPAALRPALEWFHAHRGQEIPWPSPSPVPSLDHVVTSAKGIYKPSGHDVALSVRQVLNSPYADRRVVARSDGGWVYGYHQEGADPTYFTNAALRANSERRCPVAVLLQTSAKPVARYHVQGLAMVAGWDAGFFYLEGFNASGSASESIGTSLDTVLNDEARAIVESERSVDIEIDPEHDARVRTMASIVRRQGQASFRNALLTAYGSRCAVTGCDTPEVLDAAHIRPYRGQHTNAVANGLLLRSDLHTLFDLGLIAIDPVDRTVIVSRRLSDSDYAHLAGLRMREPNDAIDQPSGDLLQAHLDWCADRI